MKWLKELFRRTQPASTLSIAKVADVLCPRCIRSFSPASLWMVSVITLLGGVGLKALANPADLDSQRILAGQQTQLCAAAVSEAQTNCSKATAAIDQLDLEILKRRQQVLTAKRQGGDISQAESELELSRDKHRLAQAKARAVELRLALAESRMTAAQLHSERLEIAQEKTNAASEQQQALEAKLAAIDGRLSALRAETAGTERQSLTAEGAAARLSAELETKWGSRITGKKPAPQPVHRSTPDKKAAPELEEATEL